jgi:MFS family permease
LIPQYLKAHGEKAGAGEAWTILLIGLYGFYRDGLEAINYYAGGAIAGRFNTRRSLLIFNGLPFVGLGILALWDTRLAVFVAIPFVFAWDSIAGPATLTVVGEAVPPERRTMAFSLQAIFRRLSRILAYVISAPLIYWLGRIQGVRADAIIAAGLVLIAVGIQFRYMRTASRDTTMALHRPRRLLRSLDPQLRRLLAADILARWAEGLAGPFIIIYCVPILSADFAAGTALYQSVLLTIQAVTNTILYVVIGPLASREGLAKKPYIGLTFLFFALFPVSIVGLGGTLGFAGLAAAFVIGGLREIGEPARKAMIADLVPPEVRTQAIGLYWSVRSLAVMWASPVGAVLWILGERLRPGLGPILAFSAAGIVGLVGVILFLARFGRGVDASTGTGTPGRT